MPRSGMYSAFCMFFVLGALTASIGASLPDLREKFGPAHAVGDIVIFYNAGALAATAGIGILGRRIKIRVALSVLLGILSCGTAGMALSPSWSWYLSFATVAGIGYGGMTLIVNTAFARGFGEASVVMVNRVNAVFGVGAMLGPLSAAAVGRTDIRLLSLAACLTSMSCALVYRAGAALETPPRAAGKAETSAGSSPLGASVILFLVAGLFYAGTETSIGAWQSTQLVRSGWNTQAATTAASAFWAGMAAGRFIVPKITRRMYAGTAVLGYLASAVIMLLLAALPHMAVVAYPLAGLCLAPVLPTLIAWVSSLASIPQRATSALTLCCMLGNAAIPAAVQSLVGRHNPEAIPLVLAGSCAACLFWAFLARWARRGGVASRIVS